MHQANELFAFVLPMGSVNRFPFIHHMTFSLARSYHRSIVASNCGVNAERTVRNLKFAFQMKVYLRPSLMEQGIAFDDSQLNTRHDHNKCGNKNPCTRGWFYGGQPR